MQKETIIHNNRKVIKTTKSNGTIIYTQRGVYIGVDVKTGKKVTSSITAKTLKSLDRKITQAQIEFEKKGLTLKETLLINNFEELAEAWFVSFVTWVTSQNTINRVRSYLDTYLIPKFGEYRPKEIKSADIHIWVNELAKQSKKFVESGVKKSKKWHVKDLVLYFTGLNPFSFSFIRLLL